MSRRNVGRRSLLQTVLAVILPVHVGERVFASNRRGHAKLDLQIDVQASTGMLDGARLRIKLRNASKRRVRILPQWPPGATFFVSLRDEDGKRSVTSSLAEYPALFTDDEVLEAGKTYTQEVALLEVLGTPIPSAGRFKLQLHYDTDLFWEMLHFERRRFWRGTALSNTVQIIIANGRIKIRDEAAFP